MRVRGAIYKGRRFMSLLPENFKKFFFPDQGQFCFSLINPRVDRLAFSSFVLLVFTSKITAFVTTSSPLIGRMRTGSTGCSCDIISAS